MNIVYIIIIITIVFDKRSFLKNVILCHKMFFRSVILIKFHELLVFVIEILVYNIFDCLINSLLLLLSRKARF